MSKKRIGRVCVLLLFAVVLGEISRTSGVFKDFSIATVIADNTAEQEPASTENQAYMDNISRACSVILNSGTKEFFMGYPVDMSFLSWIQSNFGTNAIVDIAYSLYEGNHDSELWYDYTGNSMHVLWAKYCRDMQFSTRAYASLLWKEDTTDGSTTIDVVGDVSFADDWYTSAAIAERENGVSDCFSPEVINYLNSADITIANHEFTLTDSEDKLLNKGYNFKASTQAVAYWKNLGVDIMALANNHVYDFKEQGLLDTISTLQEAGYITIGAGKNIEEASAVQYTIINGRKIAFVNASEIERTQNLTQAADETTAGVFKCLDEIRLLDVVKEADKNADFVITYIHWGFEGYLLPDERMKVLARELVAAGADTVIGGHTHRLQGVEYIDGVPVVYSLGNFWFSSGSLYTAIAQIKIDKNGKLNLQMIPCVQSDMTTSVITDKNLKDAYLKYLCDISTGVAMDPNGNVYNVKGYDHENLPYAYQSGKNYAAHNPNLDLNGNIIDSVGNLR